MNYEKKWNDFLKGDKVQSSYLKKVECFQNPHYHFPYVAWIKNNLVKK
jgi:hypothetical protein